MKKTWKNLLCASLLSNISLLKWEKSHSWFASQPLFTMTRAKLKLNEDTIMKQFLENKNHEIIKCRKSPYDSLEEHLLQWFRMRRLENVPISGAEHQHKRKKKKKNSVGPMVRKLWSLKDILRQFTSLHIHKRVYLLAYPLVHPSVILTGKCIWKRSSSFVA